MTSDEQAKLLDFYTQLLGPFAVPVSDLQEILHEAAKQAGWREPSAAIQLRQKKAVLGRNIQRQEDLAWRRIMIAHVFKLLPQRLQDKPSSIATAQAIIKKVDNLNPTRRPPITIRTVQKDIHDMKANGNFGI